MAASKISVRWLFCFDALSINHGEFIENGQKSGNVCFLGKRKKMSIFSGAWQRYDNRIQAVGDDTQQERKILYL